MAENKIITEETISRARKEIEKKRIREAINRTETEKFFLFTRLMKIHFMLKNARIIKK
jgi:hypothetical protein